jgi:Bacterial regulatory helix-turn-helix protein, lysR family
VGRSPFDVELFHLLLHAGLSRRFLRCPLRKFVAVAEDLSFTKASRHLHVVQSGVSSAIQGLERELGAALFDRNRHRAGQALLPEARATGTTSG